MTQPRILLFDIETAPIDGYTWGTYDTNVIHIIQDWYMLSFSCKWLGEEEVYTYSLPQYKTQYRKNKKDDYELVKQLWKYFDEADVIIAHNNDGFDAPKSTARFIYHGLLPPTPYKTICTLKMAKNAVLR